MSENKLKFKVHSVRTQSSPYSKEDKEESTLETIHYLLVNLRDLPAGISLEVNPRKPKMSTNVGRSLEAAVIEPETDFYINNRGIVISAKAFSFNSANSTVTVDLGNQKDEADAELYGILDGGHTYTAILKKRAAIPPGLDKYVRVEVITNVQNIARLSDARNTSMQVSDIALFNLDEKFEDVRAAIQDQPYADRVAYKDNDSQDIHVSFFLRLLFAFDIIRYPDDASAPVQSFSGKAHVFKCYSEDYQTPFYKSLTPHLPTLTALYDQIELEIPQRYKEYKMAMGGQKPNFGNVRGIERLAKEIPTMLFDNNPQMANRYFKTKLGVLEPNAAADVIIVDYHGPTPMTKENYNMHILFGMNGGMVTDTVINGEIRMRNREVQGIDEEKVWHDAQTQAQSFWKRVNQ